jgi:hypothetical protein
MGLNVKVTAYFLHSSSAAKNPCHLLLLYNFGFIQTCHMQIFRGESDPKVPATSNTQNS